MQTHVPQLDIDASAQLVPPIGMAKEFVTNYAPPLLEVQVNALCAPRVTFSDPGITFDPLWQPSDSHDLVPHARPRPFVDYEQRYTEEGGIEITYKTIDPSLWKKFLRFLAWLACTAAAGNLSFNYMDTAAASGMVIAAGILFYFLICGPRYVFHNIEIRSDCLILDREDVFWANFMELGPPEFKWDEQMETATIGVTYGNRWVELGTTTRLDPNDRTPELLQAHLRTAYAQLWKLP